MTNEKFDVIVVGAGPAGCAAARRCAEYGLRTLILEAKRFPREKVCDGLIGPNGQPLVKEVFGEIPESVYTDPAFVDGFVFHLPGVGSRKYDSRNAMTWRSRLDAWMCKKAQEKGAEFWEQSEVTGFAQENQGVSVRLNREGKEQVIEAAVLIGADGGHSIVRRTLFPEFQPLLLQQAQERFKGTIDGLERNYIHEFIMEDKPGELLGGFDVHHKDDLIIVSYGAMMGKLKQVVDWVHNYLAETYGFDPSRKPVWTQGCLEPIFGEDLAEGIFVPAKGKVLLTGDAGGFMSPNSLGGIELGIRTGLMAADAAKKAQETGQNVDQIYLGEIEPIISLFQEEIKYGKPMAASLGLGLLQLENVHMFWTRHQTIF